MPSTIRPNQAHIDTRQRISHCSRETFLKTNKLSSVETLTSQKQTGRHCIVPTRLKKKSSKRLKKNFSCKLSTFRHVETIFSESPVTETKPLKQNFFENADYDVMNVFLAENPFQAICYTNINKMCEKFTEKNFHLYVPKRANHRQSLPLLIARFWENVIKLRWTIFFKSSWLRFNMVLSVEDLCKQIGCWLSKEYMKLLIMTLTLR